MKPTNKGSDVKARRYYYVNNREQRLANLKKNLNKDTKYAELIIIIERRRHENNMIENCVIPRSRGMGDTVFIVRCVREARKKKWQIIIVAIRR